ITKNISIVNDGVGEAGILVSGGATGIAVNTPADAAVTLRGLTIKGIGFGGGSGIVFNNGAVLNVENGTIRNLDGPRPGTVFAPTSGASLHVTNTVISDNSNNGIVVRPLGADPVAGVLDRVGLYSNRGNGLVVSGAAGNAPRITVTDSVAAGNRTTGFVA